MTTPTVTTLQRRFKIGATLLADPAPELPPEEAVKLYVPNYPFIATAQLGEPELQGDFLVYPVEKPAIQTKGARQKPSRAAVQEALDALQAWEQTPGTSKAALAAWEEGVFKVCLDAVKRESAPLRDAFVIPMA